MEEELKSDSPKKENESPFIDINLIDWEAYYKQGKRSLKRQLEENPAMWNAWTSSDKRYCLICFLSIVENELEVGRCGRVTGYLDCLIYSNNIEDLKIFWNSKLIQSAFSTTMQHFIIDREDKKIIDFMSVCM